MFPSFVTLMLYLNLTVVVAISLSFKSTATMSSGSSSALCPVSIIVSSPFLFTIACVTHFLSDKSKYCTFTFSISWSSSPSFHSSGVESLSFTSFPSSSVSSEICALFIKILSDVFGSITLNAIFTSL